MGNTKERILKRREYLRKKGMAYTLPAEEVLVRGSEEPAQEQSQVLQRGTDSCQENAQQELLRSSQRQGSD
jgi:hypothetical protein